ncbi:MAG: hypothetical protein O3C40_00840 [Planctomycetota bacterium]|nr:hypothetical protein [Planctomycetota bacterium]
MRWQTVVSRTLVGAVIAVVALLLIDFSFRLETAPRAMVILVAVAIVVWRALRRIVPPLLCHETVVDMALLLERTHGVDSDLVAALQFDAAANERVGSPELQQAVIAQAAKVSETLDFRAAVPQGDARRSAWYAAIAVLTVAVGWFAFPDHAGAFWNRLWLGDAKYPTRTRIDEVMINGRINAARVVEGETVVFRVKCSGIVPDEGVARLRGIETGDSTSVMLTRVGGSSDGAVYAADGPNLNEPVDYSLRIGDAATQPRRIAIIHRPLVELTIAAVAPTYMQREDVRQHERYVQVNEGSAVALLLRCTNGKRLTAARFELIAEDGQADEGEAIAFVPADETGTQWNLDADASGLTRVVKDVPFRVVVADEDGLGTYHPIEGAMRVKPDRAPAATLASSHHAIRPNARPTIAYTVEDDFGVGSIVLHARPVETQVPAANGRGAVSIELPLPQSRGPTRAMTVRSEHVLDVSPLKLVERDKLLVWIEVTDYRGEWPGVSTLSETIELEVMDERGVLDAILRSDADAEQMLTEVIEKELGLRGDR